MNVGIYIHVPFCSKKCPYCDFYSCGYSVQASENYVKGIIRDIESFPDNPKIDTVYFGGGTPSLIPPEYIEKILQCINSKFYISVPEITLELNPSTVNINKLKFYKEMGINRLSIGVQSANDSELKLLGRKHNFEKAKEIIINAANIGFNNISCDLMLGIPGQTIDSLNNSINKISELPISHISSYILKIEAGTPFDNEEFINKMPDDEFVSEMYLFTVKALKNNGFYQYEISNFAKNGYKSRHNLKYWHCCEYIGFGPAAHSYYNGIRYYYAPDLEKYIKFPPEKIITDFEAGDSDEKLMLGLRLTEGVNLNEFQDRKKSILLKAAPLKKCGYIDLIGDRLNLTPKGFMVSNSIIAELL